MFRYKIAKYKKGKRIKKIFILQEENISYLLINLDSQKRRNDGNLEVDKTNSNSCKTLNIKKLRISVRNRILH